jgi:hypothetical protein
MTFGIGTKKLIPEDSNKQFSDIKKITNNSTLNLNIADAKLIYVPKRISQNPFLRKTECAFMSKENNYIDFMKD